MKQRSPTQEQGSLLPGERTPATPRAARWRRNKLLAIGGLATLVLAVYLPVFTAGYVMDDDINVTANPTLYAADGLQRIWLVPRSTQQYYPLTYTSFWVENRLWGFDARGYHITNVLIHVASVLLLYRLLMRLEVPGSWLAAAIFAVHPVEVESVAWITERRNVLSLALALGSLVSYLRYAPAVCDERESSVRNWGWFALSLMLFLSALLSKTVVVTLPAVLLMIYWWKSGRLGARDIVPLLPFFALAAALSAVTIWLEWNHVGAQGTDFSLTLIGRALAAGRAVWFYAGKLLWPYPTIFFYPRWTIDELAWWQCLFPLSALAVPLMLWCARNNIGRGPLTAVLLFGGVLMPMLGFINVYFHRFSFVADHFLYHASPALIALAASGAAIGYAQFLERSTTLRSMAPTIAGAVVTALLLTLATLSFDAARQFRDGETLDRDTIAKNPRSWISHSNLGLNLASQGRFGEAFDHLGDALQLAPDNAWVEHNYAKVILDHGERNGFRPGDLDEVIKHFQEAARLSPGWANPHVGIGAALFRDGRFAEASQQLSRALDIDPHNVDALHVLGVLNGEQGQLTQAQDCLQRALKIDASRAEIHFALGQVLVAQGQLFTAAQRFAQATRLQPDFASAWNNLAATLAQLGEIDRAVDAFREVTRLEPDSPAARDNLQKALDWQRQSAVGAKKRP